MAHLLGNYVDELTKHSIAVSDAVVRLLPNALLNVVQIFVADGDRRALIPSIRHAAFHGPQINVSRPSKRTKYLLHLIEGAISLQAIDQGLIILALGGRIFDANPVRRLARGGGYSRGHHDDPKGE